MKRKKIIITKNRDIEELVYQEEAKQVENAFKQSLKVSMDKKYKNFIDRKDAQQKEEIERRQRTLQAIYRLEESR